MPEVNGRFVPDDHEAASSSSDEVEEDAAPKRATRKRAGKQAETAMMDSEADK